MIGIVVSVFFLLVVRGCNILEMIDWERNGCVVLWISMNWGLVEVRDLRLLCIDCWCVVLFKIGVVSFCVIFGVSCLMV